MNTLIISAYPCCGKTYMYENFKDKYKILDSDSSDFSWIERKRTDAELKEIKREWEETPHLLNGDGYINQIKNDLIIVRNPEFPNNYIQHIKDNIGKVDIICVSSHLKVRQALTDAGIKFITVYPKEDMLDEWIGRMYRRGSSIKFIEFQIEHWNEFATSIEKEPHGEKLYRLGHNEYLYDLIGDAMYELITWE